MIGSRLISFNIKLTTGKTIKDPTSGMRAYNKKAIWEFNRNASLTPEPDTLVYMIKKGLKVKEVQGGRAGAAGARAGGPALGGGKGAEDAGEVACRGGVCACGGQGVCDGAG